jgi:hypothetical protein
MSSGSSTRREITILPPDRRFELSISLRPKATSATVFRFDRLGGAVTFYLIKPPVNAFDVGAARAAIGPVHRGERILTVRTPDTVAKAFGPLAEGTFIVHHQHDPVRADVDLRYGGSAGQVLRVTGTRFKDAQEWNSR